MPVSSPEPVAVAAPARAAERSKTDGLALYVHWPFCRSKCPYCDFNSHVAATAPDEVRWRRALIAELSHYAALTGPRPLVSIFFGGGTPSLMAPETVAAVIDAAAAAWPLARACEITLEANPNSAEAANFAGYRAAGVNRLSIGVQALDDRALAFLGRAHSVAEAIDAIALAMRAFDNVSIDLIYARPGQTVAAWRRELERALALGTPHISAYQLTLEPGTPFYRLASQGRLRLPEADQAAALFEVTRALCAEAGRPAYEVSNHARPGFESRHNLVYWQGGDYVGIGPGAHGRISGKDSIMRASRQIAAPKAWLRAVEATGHATAAIEPVDPRERAEEMVMMGLRLAQGLDLDAVARRTGVAAGQVVAPARLQALIASGHLERRGSVIRASDAGMLVLDSMLAELLA